MGNTIHIAITRRVRKSHVEAFERALAEFASRSLVEPGMSGVHLIHPPANAENPEYGILRSFSSAKERDAFYQSPLYQNWLLAIEPMVEGKADYRQLSGLEAWFRDGHQNLPPRWKMALLTWLAVWPVSMLMPAIFLPILKPNFHPIITSGLIAGGIVIILTWVAMPALVRLAHKWLHPAGNSPQNL